MLVVVQAPVPHARAGSARLEDELIRRGARAARVTGSGTVSILLEASSRAAASELASELLARAVAAASEGRDPVAEGDLDPGEGPRDE